jgi:hypothetical protein
MSYCLATLTDSPIACRCLDATTGAAGPFYRELVKVELVQSSGHDGAQDANLRSHDGLDTGPETGVPVLVVMLHTMEVSCGLPVTMYASSSKRQTGARMTFMVTVSGSVA